MEQDFLFSGIKIDKLLERIGEIIENKLLDFAPKTIIQTQPDYLSRIEVAQLLKISLPTLHEWTKLNWLQSYKIGNRVLYKESEIKEAISKLITQKNKRNGL
jgi:excisionase family DNA binding protein